VYIQFSAASVMLHDSIVREPVTATVATVIGFVALVSQSNALGTNPQLQYVACNLTYRLTYKLKFDVLIRVHYLNMSLCARLIALLLY
jgi:hypothetical protein